MNYVILAVSLILGIYFWRRSRYKEQKDDRLFSDKQVERLEAHAHNLLRHR